MPHSTNTFADWPGVGRWPGAPNGHTLWGVDLDAYALESLPDVCTPEEHAIAARRVRPGHARRHLAARHALRCALALALEADAAQLHIAADAHGKPQLPPQHALHFNLSHSGPLALIGLCRQFAVGVDIELPRTMSDEPALVQTLFTQAEQAAWPHAGTAGFLRGWTRKEACLKALGVGLALSPAEVDAGVSTERRRIAVIPGPTLAAVHVELMTLDDVPPPLQRHAPCAALAWTDPQDAMRVQLALRPIGKAPSP